jgi:undecaprenyl phosphate-alpha-L-ara4N flippase subunit ArnE
MNLSAEEGASAATRSARPWFLNPYLLILIGSLLNTTGEVLLKMGASVVATQGGWAGALGFTPLGSIWTWFGILSYIASLVSWLYVLRTVPLSIAFPLINVVHVFVPIAAAIFLHERVSLQRWMGIALILAGVCAVVKPVARAEHGL